MTVKRFDPDADKILWNRFVADSKNSTFLFHRDFMDYHADRFEDYSLLIFDAQNDLVAALPANKSTDTEIVSHQGLTYGGFMLRDGGKLVSVIQIFYHVLTFLFEHNIQTLRLKCFPAFYNTDATDEIEYVLFLLNAVLYRRDVAFAINQKYKVACSGNIRREAAKAERSGAEIISNASLDAFWQELLIPGLKSRFGVSPVHSLEEIKKLQQAFPENIKQYNTYIDGELVAGTTLFITPNVVHCQYISSNEAGRKTGALNYLFKYLLDVEFTATNYFDFGIANEKEGRALNQGMLFWKEGFGGRARKHNFYKIDTSVYTLLKDFLKTP